MESKINMPQLAAMLAIATGKQKKLCEDFLREVCRVVSDDLAKGDNVRIKGFGTFKLVDIEARKSVNVANGEEYEIPGHKKVIFVAAKELASAVNSPFEAFEAVEISDNVSAEILIGDEPEGFDDIEGIEEKATELEESILETQESIETPHSAVDESEDVDITEPESATTHKAEQDTSGLEYSDPGFSGAVSTGAVSANPGTLEPQPVEPEEEPTYDSSGYEEESGRKGRFGWGFLVGFLAAMILLGTVWYLNKRFMIIPPIYVEEINIEVPSDKLADSNIVVSVDDSIAVDTVPDTKVVGESVSGDVPTQESDAPVYDTVSKTRFLTTMATEYYGNFNFWPIIYEENKAILGHPNRIKPGTKVKIPTLKKYGVDPNNPDDIEKMKSKGKEIYARYK